MKPAYSVIDLANIDALKMIGLTRLAKTALVNTLSDVRVAELTINRFNEAEFASSIMIHFHCVLLRAVHHRVICSAASDALVMTRNYANVRTRVDRCKSWAHAHHHLGRL